MTTYVVTVAEPDGRWEVAVFGDFKAAARYWKRADMRGAVARISATIEETIPVRRQRSRARLRSA